MKDKWSTKIPELSTRPLLIEELKINKRFRRKFFRIVADLQSIPSTITHRLRGEFCTYVYQKGIANIERFREELEAKDKHIFNQAVGALRNIYANIFRKLKGPAYSLVSGNRHDVIRNGHERERKTLQG